MPRPAPKSEMSATSGDVSTVIEIPLAFVDGPDAYYYDAAVRLVGTELLVMDRDYRLVGRYELAGDPEIKQDGTIVGRAAGRPLTARPQTGCGCSGTRKVMK